MVVFYLAAPAKPPMINWNVAHTDDHDSKASVVTWRRWHPHTKLIPCFRCVGPTHRRISFDLNPFLKASTWAGSKWVIDGCTMHAEDSNAVGGLIQILIADFKIGSVWSVLDLHLVNPCPIPSTVFDYTLLLRAKTRLFWCFLGNLRHYQQKRFKSHLQNFHQFSFIVIAVSWQKNCKFLATFTTFFLEPPL